MSEASGVVESAVKISWGELSLDSRYLLIKPLYGNCRWYEVESKTAQRLMNIVYRIGSYLLLLLCEAIQMSPLEGT